MAFENWEYRKEIVIDSAKVDGDLTDFPVVVHLDADADLAANAQASGDDIAFVAPDEATQLSHEIELYDSATGTLWAHVRLPSLSSTSDTTIFLYYGNPDASNQEAASAVWDEDTAGVWHLDEEESGIGTADLYSDSSGNGYDGEDEVSATGQDGIIADGQRFDGVDDYVEVPHTLLDGQTTATLTGWVKTSTPGGFRGLFGNRLFLNQNGGGLTLRLNDADKVSLIVNGWNDTGEKSVTADFADKIDGAWHFLAATYDGSTARIYIDGTEVASKGITTTFDAPPFVDIGRYKWIDEGSAFYHEGEIDEVRMSATTRSADWIATQYANQDDPLSFYSVGQQEIPVTKQAVATASGSVLTAAVQRRSTTAPTTADTAVRPVTPSLREQRTQSVAAETAGELGTTLPLPSLTVQTPLTTAATTTTVTGRALFTAAVNSQTTAVETKTRFFKFAAAQATASTQAKTGAQALTIDAPADVIISLLTRFNLEELTQNRRSIDGTDNIDATFQTRSGDVEYDELPDNIEYDQ
jgi:hypothetical protein